MSWIKDPNHGHTYRNGMKSVLCISDGKRRWFATRRLMMLGTKRRNVRMFASAAAAMRAADKAKPTEFWV